MSEIKLPIEVRVQSKKHVCLYDSEGKYLATTLTEHQERVKAAFEASFAKTAIEQGVISNE